MATKRPAPAKKKPRRPISDKQRASDDELRERLRNFDVDVLDKALEKAIRRQPPR